jgi:hypothetical protein
VPFTKIGIVLCNVEGFTFRHQPTTMEADNLHLWRFKNGWGGSHFSTVCKKALAKSSTVLSSFSLRSASMLDQLPLA